jgi:hypothetical protein
MATPPVSDVVGLTLVLTPHRVDWGSEFADDSVPSEELAEPPLDALAQFGTTFRC